MRKTLLVLCGMLVSDLASGIEFAVTPLSDHSIFQDFDNLCGVPPYTDPFDFSVSSRTGINRESRNVLRFALGGLDSTGLVSARLRMFAESESEYGTNTFNVSRLTESWSEADASWCPRTATASWTTQGGTFTASNQASVSIPTKFGQTIGVGGPYNEWIEWDVTEIVRDWLDGVGPNHGFIVWQTDIGNNSFNQGIDFAPSESTDASLRPQLVLEFDGSATLPQAAWWMLLLVMGATFISIAGWYFVRRMPSRS